MRLRAKLGGLALLGLLCIAVAACGRGAGGTKFTGEYEVLDLASAPAELRAGVESMKTVPGLYELRQGGQVYLLLAAGRVEEPSRGIDVLEIRKPEKGGKDAQIKAILRSGRGTDYYPFTILQVEAGREITFSARLSLGHERDLELKSIPISRQ